MQKEELGGATSTLEQASWPLSLPFPLLSHWPRMVVSHFKGMIFIQGFEKLNRSPLAMTHYQNSNFQKCIAKYKYICKITRI